MLLDIDRTLNVPLADQIAAQISRLMIEGDLPPSSVLPSTRELARRLGVDRGTVARAFSRLAASGYLALDQGRRVQVRASSLPGTHPLQESLASRTAHTDTLVATPPNGHFDLRSLSPDPRLLPAKALQKAMCQVLKPENEGIEPANPRGDPCYLEMLSRRMRRHGIESTPETLIATNGAQQAFDLLLRVLLKPGMSVAVETPGYASLLALLRLHEAKVIGIPMGDKGMDLDVLRKVLETNSLCAVFTMPCFQNPTGVTTGREHRRALLQLCTTHDVPLVEDGFLEDMQYFGQAAPPIKALDTQHRVIYVGTFSKLLWPRLRLGWVAASPELTERLAYLRQTTEMGGQQIAQQAIATLQKDGTLDRYTRRAHREYRRRMIGLLRACRLHLGPQDVKFRVPTGGFTVWAESSLPSVLETTLVARLQQAGVLVQAGLPCHVAPPQYACFRLSIARCDATAVDQALSRTAQIVNSLRKEAPGC